MISVHPYEQRPECITQIYKVILDMLNGRCLFHFVKCISGETGQIP